MEDNKTIAITGASSGIGYEVAKQLSKDKHHIILIGRNESSLLEAQKSIIAETGNSNLSTEIADLSVQQQIRQLADNLHNKFDNIDVLINNAGAVFPKFELTEDGIEKTIATNHLSYFLLTSLLLDLLKTSKQGRIINVASDGHFGGRIDIESFTKKKKYFILKAYAQSKLANVLFTYELASRLKNSNLTVNALHPGRVRTKIGNKNQPWYFSLGWSFAVNVLGSVSTQTAAATYIYLATSNEVTITTGKYFDNCKEKASSKISYDKNLGALLWQTSEELCHQKFLI